MTIADEFIETFKNEVVGTVFDTSTIVNMVCDNFNRSKDSINPADYCYNKWNAGMPSKEKRCCLFEYLGAKTYKYLGENYQYNGKVYHKTKSGIEKCVGEWVDGVFSEYEVGDDCMNDVCIRDSWLLTWNPKRWEWRDFKDAVEKTKNNEIYTANWSCSNTHVKVGDRVFLTRLGTDDNGIIASGYAYRESFEDLHWNERLANEGKTIRRIGVHFDTIIDFEKDDFLGQKLLIEMFPKQKWNPQGSGIEIKKEYVQKLENLWSSVIKKDGKMVEKKFSYPNNLILYGPPGTGKTFNTITYAVAIIENKTIEEVSAENRDEVLKRYNGYRDKGLIEFCTFHQSFGYEEFIEGIKPVIENGNVLYKVQDGIFKAFCKQEDSVVPQNRVFIIDEINRGNISKIFGELITLTEDSKRIGAGEEMRTRLPYSGEKFGVPNNVYLLGTMNTADRSIALIDTALRRRFKFVEMQPDVELVDVEVAGVKIKDMLEMINRRIEVLYDREHTIGHSFFMGLNNKSTIADLAEVFDYNVIPLLKEYFYDDYERIAAVLGDNLIENNEATNFIIKQDNDYAKILNSDITVMTAYKFNRNALENPNAYKKIYE